jgi:organic radical activating enzyme
MTPETVFAQAKLIGQGCKTVTLTGGEPLEQNREDLITLISLLVQDEFHISMETNGLHDPNKILGSIGKEVYYVADFKLPSAGPAYGKHSFWSLKPTDYIKFVIQTDEDYKEAKNLQAFWPYFTNRFFSPCLPMTPKRLFDLMRRDGLTYIGLNIQLHKYIWPTDWREEEK